MLRRFRGRRMSEPRHVAAPRFCTVHRAAVFFRHPLLVRFLLFGAAARWRARAPAMQGFAFAASTEQKRGAAGWGPKSVQDSGWDGLYRMRRRPPDQIEQLTERTLSGTGCHFFLFLLFSPSCESSTSVSDVGLSPSHF